VSRHALPGPLSRHVRSAWDWASRQPVVISLVLVTLVCTLFAVALGRQSARDDERDRASEEYAKCVSGWADNLGKWADAFTKRSDEIGAARRTVDLSNAANWSIVERALTTPGVNVRPDLQRALVDYHTAAEAYRLVLERYPVPTAPASPRLVCGPSPTG
jgi:hypothetical protein